MTGDWLENAGKDVQKAVKTFNCQLLKLRELSQTGRSDAYEGIKHLVSASYMVLENEAKRRGDL